jgi:DNA helicase II / ATP-dependent DNA helicase PcrA
MNFIADLHVHSKYSRATARNLDLEHLYIGAQIKGITVIGTGDFTHPAWWAEITEKLVPAEEGLFALEPGIARHCDEQVPAPCRRPVRFMLVTEISNIYKKDERTRKNHNLVFMPDMAAAERLNRRLDVIGNVRSDGRPILGLDARNLLEIVLETATAGYVVPAHIWTPWFSLLGSKSGFDSVEACFEDLSDHIFALETGLSSDPPMNRRVTGLDRYTLISNSDAHSPAKLGREANRFACELSYGAIRAALDGSAPNSFAGTIEFFPEQGKYHVDGHRKCDFRCLPTRTRALSNICPVCGTPLVLGVLHRVEQLADRPDSFQSATAPPFCSLIPLEEVLAEVLQTGPTAKRVANAYRRLICRYGAEFDILGTVAREDLERCGIPLLAEAIERMRAGRILFDPGYDGEFGRVRIFDASERDILTGQCALFSEAKNICPEPEAPTPIPSPTPCKEPLPIQTGKTKSFSLNADQQAAVEHARGPLLIVAGPGTGKTRTITCRMVALMEKGTATAAQIVAVTFTHKAADEMRARLVAMTPPGCPQPTIGTFHGLCLQWLQQIESGPTATIVDEEGRAALMADTIRMVRSAGTPVAMSVGQALDWVAKAKQNLLGPEDDLGELLDGYADTNIFALLYQQFQALLAYQQLVDFEDILFQMVRRLTADDTLRETFRMRFSHVFVDEFQDLNHSQYQLLRLLVPPDGNICVIGDPDQAIYGFRGSDVRFFDRFMADFATPRVVRLGRNYRSTQTLVQAAAGVIQAYSSNGGNFSEANAYSRIEGGKPVDIIQAPSARAEAVAIGKAIEQMVGGTGLHALDFGIVNGTGPMRGFSDFAVLFRTLRQGVIIAEVLGQAGIPCQLASKERFVQKRPVSTLLSMLRVVADRGTHADMNLLTDVIAPGISTQTLEAFKLWAHTRQLPLGAALQAALRLPITGISTSRQQRLTSLVRFIHTLAARLQGMTVCAGIERVLDETTVGSRLAKADRGTLLAWAAPFDKDLCAFISDLAARTDTDLYQPGAQKVALMTLHAAKGLEFPVVFIAGCEKGLIPYAHPNAVPAEEDEERRLFYVAMTRAQQELYLTWSRRRTLFGKTEVRQRSPFIDDIMQELTRNAQMQFKRSVQQQLTLF